MDVGRTEIINMAMLFCNQDPILDPDGETKNAKLCDMYYDPSLQEALSGHPWSFALVAAQLQQLQKTPLDFRFKYSYQLPDNFGRMLQILSGITPSMTETPWTQEFSLADYGDPANSQPVPEYIVQGKEVYSNHRGMQILYARTDVRAREMTPQFRNYFAAYLASKLFVKITGGSEGFKDLQQKLILFRTEARNTDSEQTDTLTPNRPNLLVAARQY